jgi:hypothetical protein
VVCLQLVASVANTIAGVLLSSQRRAIVPAIGYVIYGFPGLLFVTDLHAHHFLVGDDWLWESCDAFSWLTPLSLCLGHCVVWSRLWVDLISHRSLRF